MSDSPEATGFAIENRTTVFTLRNQLRVVRDKINTPGGNVTEWEHFRSDRPAIVVVPVDRQGRIGIIRQWRQSRGESGDYTYELVSGWSEVGKPTGAQIRSEGNRELQEEMQMKATSMTEIARFELANFASVPFHVLLAEGLEPSSLPGDEPEQLGVEWLPPDEAKKKLLVDQVPTAQVLIAMNAYDNLHNGD